MVDRLTAKLNPQNSLIKDCLSMKVKFPAIQYTCTIITNACMSYTHVLIINLISYSLTVHL